MQNSLTTFRACVMLREYVDSPAVEFEAASEAEAFERARTICRNTENSIAYHVERKVPSARAKLGYVWKVVRMTV